jgi:hypothetical protein
MHTKYWDAARCKTEKICVDSINVQFRKITQDTREVEIGTELCPKMMLTTEHSSPAVTD